MVVVVSIPKPFTTPLRHLAAPRMPWTSTTHPCAISRNAWLEVHAGDSLDQPVGAAVTIRIVPLVDSAHAVPWGSATNRASAWNIAQS